METPEKIVKLIDLTLSKLKKILDKKELTEKEKNFIVSKKFRSMLDLYQLSEEEYLRISLK